MQGSCATVFCADLAAAACNAVEPGFCLGRIRWDRTKMMRSEKRNPLDQRRSGLARRALRISDTKTSRDTCGCRAAFPGLRTAKKRFKMEPET